MNTEEILPKTLSNLGIEALNPMQEAALPTILQQPNVVLLAPTGSGKTLAFLLPILLQLQPEKKGVQCLVLSPTRELAIQIERVWQKMATGFKVNTCYGGHPMTLETQNLSQPPALLIGTPGRILEHLTRQTFATDSIHMLVLDEFDKALSLGFHEQMGEIIRNLPAIEKRVLVSATNKAHIPQFTGITNPKVLNAYKAPEQTTAALEVKSVVADDEGKAAALFHLLCTIGSEQTLVFCNLRDTTESLRDFLENQGIPCACFHGGMEQQDREKTLVQFRNGTILYLITSDLAARGLDIPDVRHVVHFEMPLKHHDFTHRNGRTARMHADGTAYVMLAQDETPPVYLENLPPTFALPPIEGLPARSVWTTLYISGGKKDKLGKTDIVGFFTQKGGISKDDIGKIELMDFMSFVAVKKAVAPELLKAVQAEKMKGKKYKIVVTY
jgi:superfamily II DNA/RNA helicase